MKDDVVKRLERIERRLKSPARSDKGASDPIAPEMLYRIPVKSKYDFDPLRDYKERDYEDRIWEPKEV